MIMGSKRHQQGFSLSEALVAFAIVTGGLLAVASFQAGLFSNSAYNKARTEALSLAQEKIEEFKHYAHATEDNYVDDNDDGVMDADGAYTETAISGNNADFVRSWNLSTSDDGKRIGVTVAWVDSANETQSVSLGSSISFISPRSGADQLVELKDPLVASPTGRAERAEGDLSDYPAADVSQVSSAGVDGMSTYQYQDDLFLVDSNNKVLLRLRDACLASSGVCTDFVRISGTVYVDTANVSGALEPDEIIVIASNTAHCQRYVDSGSLSSPPTTSNGDYKYFNYTCYFGGGWHGNIGFVTSAGLSQSDKVCQGDPTSLNAWEDPVIALRRVYRGMLHQSSGSSTRYFSHGVADATTITGQDFVFTRLASDKTTGDNCVGTDAPMTRTDSAAGQLFQGMPVAFVCLNKDYDGDSSPDYLDAYDSASYGANLSCPFDPVDPPVLSYSISGTIDVFAAGLLDLGAFDVVTSDGPDNCTFASPFTATASGYTAQYSCTVWDWGDGWTGTVQARPNSTDVFCPSDSATYTDILTDQTLNVGCQSTNTVQVQGSIVYVTSGTPVTNVSITDLYTGFQGKCEFDVNVYSCLLPYSGSSADFNLTATSLAEVCGSIDGTTTFYGYTSAGSPYTHDIVVSNDDTLCTMAVTEPAL
jgi:Tfp pilus assembly protein PilV